ncbi:MAG TPA: hypothetical protein VHQ93_15670 [Chitinophagaceae bacterium]|nr:hypothetical protein [Chitinophagaceae bacterium]
MEILWLILFLYLEVYSIFYIIYFLVKIARGVKIPGYLVISNGFVIGIFFLVRRMINNHELFFVGGYKEDPENWETGLANMVSSLNNLTILLFIFFFTQIIFWAIFIYRYRKLNPQKEKNELVDM